MHLGLFVNLIYRRTVPLYQSNCAHKKYLNVNPLPSSPKQGLKQINTEMI